MPWEPKHALPTGVDCMAIFWHKVHQVGLSTCHILYRSSLHTEYLSSQHRTKAFALDHMIHICRCSCFSNRDSLFVGLFVLAYITWGQKHHPKEINRSEVLISDLTRLIQESLSHDNCIDFWHSQTCANRNLYSPK